MTKKCGDCTHSYQYGYSLHCNYTRKIHPLTGLQRGDRLDGKECKSERKSGDCGPEAKNFDRPLLIPDDFSDRPCRDCVHRFTYGYQACCGLTYIKDEYTDEMNVPESCARERVYGNCKNAENFEAKIECTAKGFWATIASLFESKT